MGIQPPKLSKFRILAINLPLRCHSFAQFLRNFQILYASVGSFYVLMWSLSRDKQPSYKHFSAVGAFSLKYSIAPSGETTDRIKKKLRGAKMVRISSITMPSMVEIVGRAPAVDHKVWCCFVRMSRFGITKFVITEILWSSQIFNRQNYWSDQKTLGEGCKNGTDLLYHHAMYGGDRGSRAVCRRKSDVFCLFFFVFFVTLWNYEVCDNGNAIKLCNFQNNYGVIAA